MCHWDNSRADCMETFAYRSSTCLLPLIVGPSSRRITATLAFPSTAARIKYSYPAARIKKKFIECMKQYKRLIRDAKSIYHENLFEKCKNDARATWKLINQFLGKQRSNNRVRLSINSTKVEDLTMETWNNINVL